MKKAGIEPAFSVFASRVSYTGSQVKTDAVAPRSV